MKSTLQLLKVLDSAAISRLLANLNNVPGATWKVDLAESALTCDYKFLSFPKTWEFLNTVAILAHNDKHHPTITTTYTNVNIKLCTHDAGNQVTEKDTRLAWAIQKEYGRRTTTPVTLDLVKEARVHVKMQKAAQIIDELTKSH